MKNARKTKKDLIEHEILSNRIKEKLNNHMYSNHSEAEVKSDVELTNLIERIQRCEKRLDKNLGKPADNNKPFEVQESERLSTLMNSKDRKKPLIKIKDKQIKLGSVVFLKNQEDINEEYNKELNDLISTHHRFAIGVYFGPKSNAVAVHLLSTSDFVNETNSCGCKLLGDYGNYGNGKSVYLDLQTAYVIKKSCILNYQYDLIKQDKCLLEDNIFTAMGKQTIFIKGLYKSGVIDREFDNYEALNHCSYKQDSELDDLKVRIIQITM